MISSAAAAAAALAAGSLPPPARGNSWINATGNANWSTAANWSAAAVPAAAQSADFPSGFPGGDTTILLSSGEQCSSLTLGDAYTLSGGTLAISGTGGIAVAANRIATVASVLSGINGLTKTGSGVLIPSNPGNTFSGDIDVQGGALQLSAPGQLGTDSPNRVLMLSGGALITTASMSTGLRKVTLGAGGGTFTPAVNTFLTIGTLQTTANPLTMNGHGTLILSGSSQRTGTTVITSGTVRMNDDQTLGTGLATVGAGATVELRDVSVTSPLALAAGSTLSDLPFTNAAGNCTYAGTITVAGGAAVTLDTGSMAGDVFTIGDANHQPNTYTGGSGATTTVSGIGTLVIPFGQNYTGGWAVGSGSTVRIEDPSALGTGSSPVVVNAGTLHVFAVTLGRALTLNNGAQLRASISPSCNGVMTVAAGASASINVDNAAYTLTLGDGANDVTSTGVADLSVVGPGTLALPQASNFSGRWHLQAGTTRVSNATSLGLTSNVIDLAGGTLELSNIALANPATFGGGSTLRASGAGAAVNGVVSVATGAAVTLAAPASGDVLTLGNGANDLTGGGGTATITVTGAGKVVPAQSSNYSGNWLVSGGTLQVAAENQLGSLVGDVTLSAGGTLAVTTGFSTTRGFALGTGGGNLTVAAGQTFSLISPLPANANALLANGSGTLQLSDASTRTGPTTIRNGTLRLTNATALGSGGITVNTGGRLDLKNVIAGQPVSLGAGGGIVATGTSTYTGTITVAAGAAVTLGGADTASLTIGNGFNDLTGGGSGSGVTVPALAAGGKVVMSQPSNYTGNWTVIGTLEILGNDRLGSSGNSVMLNGGTLRTAAAFTGTRSVGVDAGGGKFDSNGFNTTFGGVVGAGTLTKISAGKLTVSIVRGGGLTINGGGVILAPNGSDNAASRLSSLAIGTGTLDLTDNKLFFNTPGSAGTFDGSSYTGVQGQVAAGRHGGDWAGSGIVTSDTRAVNTSDFASLGVATFSQIRGLGATETDMFGVLPVTGSDTLVMLTYGGDANLDGVINIDDYTQIDSSVSVGGSLKGWFNGDFNYDGNVDIDDYTIIDSNITIQGPPFPTASGATVSAVTAVPEPSGAAVALLACYGLGFRRRRRCARAS